MEDFIMKRIMKEGKTATAKCPDCGGKYIKATKYCPSCKKKVKEVNAMENANIIELPEDVTIDMGDREVILEKGERIEVVNKVEESRIADNIYSEVAALVRESIEETITGRGFDLGMDTQLYDSLVGYVGADATVYLLEGEGTAGVSAMLSGVFEFVQGSIIVKFNRERWIQIHYKDIASYRFVMGERFIDLQMKQGNTITVQFNV